MSTTLAILAGVFVVTLVLIQGLGRVAPIIRLVDLPNHRSLHHGPIPKVGGLAILIASGTTVALTATRPDWFLLILTVLLTLVSAWDDARNLPAGVRLSVHGFAAVAMVVSHPSADWLFMGLAVITMIWMANLYNFMDGADGLAGGMTVLGFGALAIVLSGKGLDGLALFATAISVAALAFLCFNFSPASVFMGDAGAVPLGFLAAGIGYLGYLGDAWPYWYPALVFSPFIFDASYTLLRRARRGERLWSAHREHLYQRLILAGWTHRKLALVAYGIMFAVNMAALIALQLREAMQVAAIVFALMLLVVLFVLAERHLAKMNKRAHL